MYHNLKDFFDYSVWTADGEIGRVFDFYFEDFSWVVRYFVIDTREWLDEQVVLLSPLSLMSIDPSEKIITVKPTREVIEESPKITIGLPLTRRQEKDLHSYYEWPFYWEGVDLASYGLAELAADIEEKTSQLEGSEVEDIQVHRFKDVVGYDIHARDGDIGKVDNLIIDDQTWRILYMIVNAGTLLQSRKVLLSLQWIQQVNWGTSEVIVDLKKETIEKSPIYDISQPLERDYEDRLYRHYGKKRYWEDDDDQGLVIRD